MEYTKNYHLPQWVKEDRIMMDDFNQMCADMEAGLNSNAQAAETAQQSAETAHEAARDAKAEALKLPYVIGSYTGNGADTRAFNLGFRPRFVIICSALQQSSEVNGSNRGVVMAGPTPRISKITLTDTGFQFEKSNYNPHPNLNSVHYDYIAFR